MAPVTREPLVSAIIPTRHRPQLLERAVASALAQTWSALDVVVVDDASEPEMRLPAFEDPRVHVVRLSEPSGPGAARNAGIARARGELIAFLDDDDEWRPDKTARQVQHLLAGGPALAWVACGYDLWNGSRLVQRTHPPSGDLRHGLLANPCLAPSTVLLRRSAVEAVGGFDPTVYRCEDWDLWVRLADGHRLETLREVLVDRRQHALPPEETLKALQAMVARLGGRIDALPSGKRDKVRAHHELVYGVLHAQMGRPSEARALMWSAWRRHPGSPRPLLHMLRTVTGELIWEGAAARLRRPHVRGTISGGRKARPAAPPRVRP